MNFLVQFPTYYRAHKFVGVLKKYIDMTSGSHNVFFNINCDLADLTMMDGDICTEIRQLLSNPKKPHIDGKQNFDVNTTKISAINSHIDERHFDVVICASDDMVPVMDNWDEHISNAMLTHFPKLDGCVYFNDGNRGEELITFSIMGCHLYEYFGYIYHPDYKALYCDDEFTEEVKKLGKCKYIDQILFSHEHWSINGSENFQQIDSAIEKTLKFAGYDKLVYEKRKALGFPKERVTK